MFLIILFSFKFQISLQCSYRSFV